MIDLILAQIGSVSIEGVNIHPERFSLGSLAV